MLAFIRTVLFYILDILVLMLMTISVVLMFLFPVRVRYRIAALWPRFSIWWLSVICGVKYEIQGFENIPDQPVIIMCKHSSTWETMAMQGLFPPQAWIVKRELFWVPVFGWALYMINPIAIDRSKGRRAMEQLLDQGANRLDQGFNVAIFPEGTRIDAGKKGKYKIGGALLAEKTGAPVVPVAHNAGYFWPKHGFSKKPGHIKMIIGEPIDTKGMSASQINQRVEEWIESRVAKISVTE
ncbi:MAG: 1-acyl-sn-glycerol-3-phosphate acyltransferase [Gammaproteobacteria bacterium]|nr:1-acyl-sn-glycerol-3-phosphate acyltransferase [Gammaproteobacteria bacterium]